MQNPYDYILQVKMPDSTPAQEALKKALIVLLQTKSLGDITVKELCAQAFVARSTFYAYYQNIDDVLTEIEDRLVFTLLHQNPEIMARGINEEEQVQFYAQTLKYVSENKESFYTLLISNADFRFMEKWKSAIKYHFWERLFCDRTARNSGLILESVASVTISFYAYWLKNPDDVDTGSIYALISALLKMLDYVD